MGNTITHPTSNVFEKELEQLNNIINAIINEHDLFKNKHYDFLSEDICKKYLVIFESDLQKHLKLDIKKLGESLYILPKHEDTNRVNKQEICKKLSNHYMRILYIMCMVKYVYNTEKQGDLSIAGIVLRNIKIIDDMMQITFCAMPHKVYSSTVTDKIDFSKLEGLKFFTEYFLTKEESVAFVSILRSILARSNSHVVKHHMCKLKNLKELNQLFTSRFPSEQLSCKKQQGGSLNLYLNKDSPVFDADYCAAPLKLVVKLNTSEGRKVYNLYKKMRSNYKNNIESVTSILQKLTYKSHDSYELKDIDKETLDAIIEELKVKVQVFYIQSIIDYQNLLDNAKKTPNIHLS